MKRGVLVLSTFVLSTTGALAADQSPGSGSPRTACKADVEKLCSDVSPGSGRILACLRQNEAQVSAACKEAIAHARQKRTPQTAPSPQS